MPLRLILAGFQKDQSRTDGLSGARNKHALPLGRHEIAALQAPAKDAIRPTTTLAQASGEWMSAESPVCANTETNAPGGCLHAPAAAPTMHLIAIAGIDDASSTAVRTTPT